MISINIQKAREVKKAKLREERAPLLQTQDVAFQRALETGQDTSAIVAEKQRLRDITKLCDAVQNIEELKQITIES